MINIILLILSTIFIALMLVAAFFDLLTMTIPNKLCLLVAALFFPLAFTAGMPLSLIGIHILLGLGVLVIGFILFSLGWIGGGDAKLAAAIALWMGTAQVLPWFVYSAFGGGILTVLILLARQVPLPLFLARQDWVARLHDPQAGVPYGIALAIAGIIVYLETSVFLGLSI